MYTNLSMTLLGVSPLSTDSWDTYEEVYTEFCDAFYLPFPQYDVSITYMVLEFVSQHPPLRLNQSGSLRGLQDQLMLICNQTISYSKGSDTRAI